MPQWMENEVEFSKAIDQTHPVITGRIKGN